MSLQNTYETSQPEKSPIVKDFSSYQAAQLPPVLFNLL
jgi:hypothetical protein